MGWAALIIVGALAVVATGYIIGLAVSSPGEIRSPAGGDPNTCADFCMAWERSRAALCGALSNLAAARAFANSCWNAWLAALATAAALTAASVACLTIYDMAKAVDRGMVISGIRLVEKTGGKSGDYKAKPGAAG